MMGQTKKIFRWVLLITDVVGLLLCVIGSVYSPATSGVVAGVAFGVMFLANIIFISMTWRWRNVRKEIGRITGVFE